MSAHLRKAVLDLLWNFSGYGTASPGNRPSHSSSSAEQRYAPRNVPGGRRIHFMSTVCAVVFQPLIASLALPVSARAGYSISITRVSPANSET